MNKTNSPSVNHQDHPHQEGNQNNTATTDSSRGQKRGENNNQPMSNMMNESEEQRGGQLHGQNDESQVQQEERLP